MIITTLRDSNTLCRHKEQDTLNFLGAKGEEFDTNFPVSIVNYQQIIIHLKWSDWKEKTVIAWSRT